MPDDGKTRGRSVAELKTASDLKAKLDELKKSRQKFERDWKLNLAFYRGNQYSYVSKTGRLESLPVEDLQKPRYRVRLVSNQIVTGSQSLISKYLKTKPVMNATPASASDADVKAAQMAEQLLEDWWITLGMPDKLEEALLWSLVAGQGYWKISWDQHAGHPMTFVRNPEDGGVITDDNLIDLFRKQLQEVGLPPDAMDETVFLGDVRIDVLSPFQVWFDPSARTISEAKWAICEHGLDPDEVQTRFGRKVEPDAIPSDPSVTLPLGVGDNNAPSSDKSVKKVYFGYFLPQAALPKGRYVVWVDSVGGENADEDDSKKILLDTAYPMQYGNMLPIVKFGGVRVPGSIYDEAIITSARPLQKELNRTLSQIVEYKNLTIKPRIWAPIGSLKTRYTSEPGAVYEFQPIAGLRPEIEKLPAMPPYVFEHLKDVTMRLREVFGLTEVSEGTVPPNVEAGVAIDLLQEMSTDRLAPTIRAIEDSLARAGKLLLMLAKDYYVEPRLLKIRGSGGSAQVRRFKGADIASGVDVVAESGSGLPRTRAGRQARIESLLDRGLIAPQQAWKHIDLADMRSVAQGFAADEDQAYREHDKLIGGQPINPMALEAALQAVQQGINPETGQPLQAPEEAQMVLMTAALTPGPADNHMVHADIHKRLIISVEFDALPPPIQQALIQHYTLTMDAVAAQQPAPEGNAPRVNMAIKGTIGPTGASEILKRAGVDVPPEVMMEQPLETWVTDKIDEPDVEEAGNDPFTAEEQMGVLRKQRIEEAKLAAEAVRAVRSADPNDPLDENRPAEQAKARGNSS